MRLIAFMAGFVGGMIVQLALIMAADYLISFVVTAAVVPQVMENQPEEQKVEPEEQKVEPEEYLPQLEWQYFGPRPWWVDQQWNSGCGCGCRRGA